MQGIIIEYRTLVGISKLPAIALLCSHDGGQHPNDAEIQDFFKIRVEKSENDANVQDYFLKQPDLRSNRKNDAESQEKH